MATEEEDDYMNFTFEEAAPAKESSIQRAARLKKEGLERGRIASKEEKEAKAKADRDAALATQLDSSNKGAKMMAKMGFKGGALGQAGDARTTPIELLLKDDRGGIGMDSEKKRKVREAAEEAQEGEKRQKVGLDEFRERNASERVERRAEGLLRNAMKVLEGFEEANEGGEKEARGEDEESTKQQDDDNITSKPNPQKKQLRDVNLLYRPLVRYRLEKERPRKMRHDMNNSSLRNDADANSDDEQKQASFDPRVEELDDEDPELEEFEALPAAERLEKVVMGLREKYWYCFWCKFRYEDEGIEGCPGVEEDAHG